MKVDPKTVELMRQVSEFLVQAVADEGRPMAFVEVADKEGEHGLVVVIRGRERIDKVMPALRKLCPEDIVRDGEPVGVTKGYSGEPE